MNATVDLAEYNMFVICTKRIRKNECSACVALIASCCCCMQLWLLQTHAGRTSNVHRANKCNATFPTLVLLQRLLRKT